MTLSIKHCKCQGIHFLHITFVFSFFYDSLTIVIFFFTHHLRPHSPLLPSTYSLVRAFLRPCIHNTGVPTGFHSICTAFSRHFVCSQPLNNALQYFGIAWCFTSTYSPKIAFCRWSGFCFILNRGTNDFIWRVFLTMFCSLCDWVRTTAIIGHSRCSCTALIKFWRFMISFSDVSLLKHGTFLNLLRHRYPVSVHFSIPTSTLFSVLFYLHS